METSLLAHKIDRTWLRNSITKLCIRASCNLPGEFLQRLHVALKQYNRKNTYCHHVLKTLIENAHIAKKNKLPICQDTGTVVVFVYVGPDIILPADMYTAIDEGVAAAQRLGYLRPSIVRHPLDKRENTNTNTPAIVHVIFEPSAKLRLCVLLKGAGAENHNKLFLFEPLYPKNKIVNTIVKYIKQVALYSCPPLSIGIAIGSSSEDAMKRAKMLHTIDRKNNSFEKSIIDKINTDMPLVIKLYVDIKPTHIAMLPVAIDVGCCACRYSYTDITI